MFKRFIMLAACLVVFSNHSMASAQSFERNITDTIKRLTNEFRTKNGMRPMRYNPKIEWAADLLAREMAKQEKLGHGVDGRKNAGERLDARNYNWVAWGENVTVAPDLYTDAAEAHFIMFHWENSGYRKNMLDARFLEFGVSVFRAKNGRLYAVQIFATPEEYTWYHYVTIQNYSFDQIMVWDDDGLCNILRPFETKVTFVRSGDRDRLPKLEITNWQFIANSGNTVSDGMTVTVLDSSYFYHGVISRYLTAHYHW